MAGLDGVRCDDHPSDVVGRRLRRCALQPAHDRHAVGRRVPGVHHARGAVGTWAWSPGEVGRGWRLPGPGGPDPRHRCLDRRRRGRCGDRRPSGGQERCQGPVGPVVVRRRDGRHVRVGPGLLRAVRPVACVLGRLVGVRHLHVGGHRSEPVRAARTRLARVVRVRSHPCTGHHRRRRVRAARRRPLGRPVPARTPAAPAPPVLVGCGLVRDHPHAAVLVALLRRHHAATGTDGGGVGLAPRGPRRAHRWPDTGAVRDRRRPRGGIAAVVRHGADGRRFGGGEFVHRRRRRRLRPRSGPRRNQPIGAGGARPGVRSGRPDGRMDESSMAIPGLPPCVGHPLHLEELPDGGDLPRTHLHRLHRARQLGPLDR